MIHDKHIAEGELLSVRQATGILSGLFVAMTVVGLAIPVVLHWRRWRPSTFQYGTELY